MPEKKGLKLSRKALQNCILLIILVLLIIFFTSKNPRFFASRNFINLSRQTVHLVLMGCAMAFVIFTGGIDLSVGSVMAFTAVMFAYFCKWGVNIWLGALFCMLIGIFVGILNGFMIVKLKIAPIMATIATMTSVSGLAYTICKAIPVQTENIKPITFLNKGMIAGVIPIPLVFIIVSVAIFIFLEKKTILGKYSIAIGGNENAAVFSGINVGKMKLFIYSLSGFMAALAGILATSRSGQGDPTTGAGLETMVIAGCILGGINIKGGEGSLAGMFLGTIILAVLTNGMNMIGVSSFYQQVATGAVILIAVLIDVVVRKRGTGFITKKKDAVQSA